MKYIQNNNSNYLTFVKDEIDFSDLSLIGFKQIGSELIKKVPVISMEEDCFTITVRVDIVENYTPNGLYTIMLLDSIEEVILKDTAEVTNMEDNDKREFIIEEELIGVNKLKIPQDVYIEQA